MRAPTLQAVLPVKAAGRSVIGKAKAGAARQLHRRANSGCGARDGSETFGSTLQVVDFQCVFRAQSCSIATNGAPILAQSAAEPGFSTKLSTTSVDGDCARERRLLHTDGADAQRAKNGPVAAP